MSFFCVILFLYVCQFSCEAYLGFSRLEIVLKECTVQETRSIFPPSSYFASDIYIFLFHLQFVTPIKHFHLLQNNLKYAKPPVVNTQALQTYTLSRARMHTDTYRFTLMHSGMPAVDGIVICTGALIRLLVCSISHREPSSADPNIEAINLALAQIARTDSLS